MLAAALAVGCGDDDGPAEDDPGTDMGGSSSDLGTSPGDDLGTSPGDDLGTSPGDDLGTSAGDDMGTTTDTDGGSGTVGTIDCGEMTCDAETQECCASFAGGSATFECITAGDTCMGGTAECDGPEDCGGGEVCCGSGGAGGASVECAATCEGFGSFELCHEATDCTSGTDMCCPIMMFGISGGACLPMCGFAP